MNVDHLQNQCSAIDKNAAIRGEGRASITHHSSQRECEPENKRLHMI